MRAGFFILLLCLVLLSYKSELYSQETSDSLVFSGQLIGWGGLNFKNPGIQQLGVRYLPELSYSLHNARNFNFDIDASVNVYSDIRFTGWKYDTIQSELRPYRLFARISSDQWEIRAGLQKISFGSASMLRPLMWFDKIDARDPLQLTDGVYSVLGRYYFLNNTNIWIWGLYGNNERRGWDIIHTAEKKPEFGGRVQLPILNGEMALSYHHRMANYTDQSIVSPDLLVFPENKFGLDGKWDIGAGIWFEYVYKNSNTSILNLNRQEHYLNLGSDYTFLVGNGLNLSAEQFMLLAESNLDQSWKDQNFTALSMSYPFGMIDRASIMVFYNYENQSWYRFINFQRQYDNLSLYLMLYWNPDNFNLYASSEGVNMFSGRGIQIMLCFNH